MCHNGLPSPFPNNDSIDLNGSLAYRLELELELELECACARVPYEISVYDGMNARKRGTPDGEFTSFFKFFLLIRLADIAIFGIRTDRSMCVAVLRVGIAGR